MEKILNRSDPEDPDRGPPEDPNRSDPEDPRCRVAGPTVQRTGSRSFPIASASSVSLAVVVVRHAKRCSDTGIRSLATIVLKIQEALSISPVKSISLLHSQASRRSPRIWLPSPSHFVRCVTVLSSIPESLNRKVPTCLPNEPVSAARSTGIILVYVSNLGAVELTAKRLLIYKLQYALRGYCAVSHASSTFKNLHRFFTFHAILSTH